MTRSTMGEASPGSPVMPWTDLRFIIPVALIPLLTFVTMIMWQDDARAAFRAIQLCFGCAVIVQLVFVFMNAFERGWYEFFAYLLHFVAIGAASLTVTFRLEQYSQDLPYDQMALLGMAGQLILGCMALFSTPLQQRARLDTRALAICIMIVCSAALIKFGFYIQYVGLSGGHNDIYTEGDALRDNAPPAIRILAAGAPLIGLLALTHPGLPRWCRALGALSIILEFAIGIRSRPLFVILSALALTQHSFRITPTRKMLMIVGSVLAVIGVAAIGYFREGNKGTVEEYFWIILESLFGVFEAGVLGAQLPYVTPTVVGQIVPLLAPTPLLDIDTVAKMLTVTFTPQMYLWGYGYSSAALTETTMLLGLVLSGLAYPLIVLGIVTLIKAAVTSRYNWAFLYGVCVLPISCYIWRAELWQLAVPAIKALPFIAVLLGADAYARLGQARRPLRPPVPTRRPHTS